MCACLFLVAKKNFKSIYRSLFVSGKVRVLCFFEPHQQNKSGFGLELIGSFTALANYLALDQWFSTGVSPNPRAPAKQCGGSACLQFRAEFK